MAKTNFCQRGRVAGESWEWHKMVPNGGKSPGGVRGGRGRGKAKTTFWLIGKATVWFYVFPFPSIIISLILSRLTGGPACAVPTVRQRRPPSGGETTRSDSQLTAI